MFPQALSVLIVLALADAVFRMRVDKKHSTVTALTLNDAGGVIQIWAGSASFFWRRN
jgi:hypothetical protein